MSDQNTVHDKNQQVHDHDHSHNHSHLMNFEEREKILPSEKILRNFGLRPGRTLADLGCGYGFFTLRAAELAGPEGRIEAVDIEPERLKFLTERAAERKLRERITVHLAAGEKIPLPDGCVDSVLIANVLHELEEPLAYLQDAQRILRAEGQLWVVEWQKKETPMGPPLAERKSTEEWGALFIASGFTNIWLQLLEPSHVLLRANKG